MSNPCTSYDTCNEQSNKRMKLGEGMKHATPYMKATAGQDCYTKSPPGSVNFVEGFGSKRINRAIRWIIIIIILYILATLIFKLFKPKEIINLGLSSEAPRLRGDTIKRWFVL